MGQLDCEDTGYAETGLQRIPERVTVFRHVDSECESLASRFVLNNTQPSSLQINGARVSPNFEVDGVQLPLALLPGQPMPIQVRYLGEALNSEEGTLTVSTSSGCVDFAIRGLASDGSLMTYSDLAIDFGAVRAGSVSEPREFIMKDQRTAASVETIYAGFSAGPSETFQVLAAPVGPQSLESCDEVRFQIRFRAPQTPGRIEGALGWSATTETEEGTFVGDVLVPLYGTVIAD